MSPQETAPAPPAPPGLKHPGRWLWLFLLIPALIGLTRLQFDVQVFDLLPADLPAVKGLILYQQHFANARELIITLEGSGPDETESAARAIAESLRAEPKLVSSVTWEPPWLEHPEQAAELIGYLWLNQPAQALQELTNRLARQNLAALLTSVREDLASSMSPQEIARLSYDPFGFTRLPQNAEAAAPSFAQGQELFSSADGTFRILFVQARSELKTYRQCAEWLDKVKPAVQRAIRAAEPSNGNSGSPVTAGYTGGPAFVSEVALGMQHDMTVSVGGTAVIIAILFWLAHRRFKPMLWLLTLLAVILAVTLALGGLIFGAINVVSMGFAAILLGLAVDYAVVHYQEALAHPALTIPQIRRAIAPSIFWAAVTTIAAFLVLNFGGLPGLGQLGTLVGLGVALAATIMIFEFLPPLFPHRATEGSRADVPKVPAPQPEIAASGFQRPASRNGFSKALVPVITGVLLLSVTVIIFVRGFPPIDTTANALRPRNSPAYAALDQVQRQLTGGTGDGASPGKEPLWLIVHGASPEQVSERLNAAEVVLRTGTNNGTIAGFKLPTPLWPREDLQLQNRAAAAHLVAEFPVLRQAALTNGFSEASLGLAEGVLKTWQSAASPSLFWPTNPMSQWIFEKFSAGRTGNYFVLGQVTSSLSSSFSNLSALQAQLPPHDVWLSGWSLLGHAIFARVQANMWKVLAPMILLVLVALLLAFRRPLEICLALAVLLVSGACLLSIMRVSGGSWNLLNLMAIPLILGTGVDYSLFMLLALRRHGGDLAIAYASVGRALLLCGGTAIAGFGSLGLSSNAGMASLGQVCAIGIACNMLIAIFLLPRWWQSFSDPTLEARPSTPSTPSSLYRSEIWRLGLLLVGMLPQRGCEILARFLATVYCAAAVHRRDVVVRNLLPALQHDSRAAARVARALFKEFAIKVVHLWRFEAGLPINHLLGPTSGWEHFETARAQKRGILLLTPHLGNWEFGGPLLTSRGIALQVITLAEPGQRFTELRQASRARWNIETLVIRDDPFAFLEIIRRLDEGATVALLVDRPPPATAVRVRLFGQPFDASVAAAELARASGCVLLPVYLPRIGSSYEAHILPPVPYDRPALRDRAARQELTQRIISTFEPLIRKHLDQWYHFVSVWPPGGKV